ncbi:autotransporter assembly complex protein TamA [Swingsia samuiensis]|uniref:Outer membrane protein assembly factor n=1 Tax=Swingsia samuiensis TaxID=1293412 RepID=A0A4Y6UJ84_9PROT|nr:BamA/TamA family outer membrane protein [Swingsia samuiensis]QDH17679.1 hypothetical protein E3D00_08965 [Swingsia samuiensis]
MLLIKDTQLFLKIGVVGFLVKTSRYLIIFCSLVVSSLSGTCFPFRGYADSLKEEGTEKTKTLGYKVAIEPTKDSALDAAIAASSQLSTLQETQKVGAYALTGRINGDYDRVDAALQSQGYYAGAVAIKVQVDGHELDGRSPQLPEALQAARDNQKIKISVSVEAGQKFHLGRIILTTPPKVLEKSGTKNDKGQQVSVKTSDQAEKQGEPVTLSSEEQKAFNLVSGQPAVAGDVLAAQNNLLNQLQEEGYAVASVSTPLAYLKPASHSLDVVFRVGRGPKVVIGPMSMSGLKKVHETYLKRRLTLQEGQLYQPSKIEQARQDLTSTGVFSAVQVKNAPPIITLASGKSLVPGIVQAMPLDFDFHETKRHTLTAEAGYSTDLGGRAGVSWTHHNLFGNAEQLKLAVLATGLGGSAQQGLGYDAYADFTKPDFLRKDQSLNLRIEAVRQLLYSYHQNAILARGGIGRHFGKYWYISAGLMGIQEQIKQFGDKRNYFIASIPLVATYDSTGLSNPIDPATHGIRASITASPSMSFEHKTSFFALLTAQVSTYYDLARLGWTKPGNSIIAVRGIVGSVQGASTYDIPPDQRLYAGGPATVRGFRYQGVGPQYGDTKYAIGGTSMDAGTLEFRQRLPKNLGMAAFVDAGQVSTKSTPGHGTVRVGYGAGVRYYTPIGPVRVDVALPVNRPPHGGKWELYIGLGETF